MDYRRAVSDTVKYASFFHFPLTRDEIHFWLITSKKISRSKLKPYLPKELSMAENKFRNETSAYTNLKINLAKKLVDKLKFIPGLKMVAITGSVSAGNAKANDDIDLLFVTSPYTLWLIRPIVILLISIFFRRRYPGESHSDSPNAFCPNLWLETVSLSVPEEKRNLYTAHEVLQVLPVYDKADTYQLFLRQNSWSKKFLANAYSFKINHSIKKLPSADLSFIFYPFNLFSYFLQILYMKPKKTTETVHLHAAFLHTTDFDSQIRHIIS